MPAIPEPSSEGSTAPPIEMPGGKATPEEIEAFMDEQLPLYFSADVVKMIKFMGSFPDGKIPENWPAVEPPPASILDDLPEGVTLDDMRGELGEKMVGLADYLKTIAQFMVGMRKMLNDLQAMTAAQLKRSGQEKLALIDGARDMLENVLSKTQELRDDLAAQREEAEKAKKRGTWIKVGLVIATVLLTVAAIAATVLTAGACTPLLVGAIALNVIIMGVVIADTVTDGGVYGKKLAEIGPDIFNGICEVVSFGAYDKDVDSPLNTFFKILAVVVIVVIVIALIVLTKGSGGSAAASGATGAGSAAASAAASAATTAAVRQLLAMAVMTLLLTVLTSSNVLFVGVQDIAVDCGADEEQAMIAAMVISTILLIGIGIAGGAAVFRGAAKNMGKHGSSISKAMAALEAIETAGQVGSQISTAYFEFRMHALKLHQAVVTEEIAEIQLQIDMIKDVLLKLMGLDEESLRTELDKIAQDVKDMADAFVKFLTGIQQMMAPVFTALS